MAMTPVMTSLVHDWRVSAPMDKIMSLILMTSLLIMLDCQTTFVESSVAPNITYRISENNAIGTQIGDVIQDSGLSAAYSSTDLSRFTFSFLSTSSIDFLSIDRKSGVIRVLSAIDRSSICPYADVCQLAVDVLISPVVQVIHVLIVLLSANRHAPSFPVSVVRLNMTANAPPNTTWTLPEADDPDGGVEGVQGYRLTQLYPALVSSPAFALVVVQLPDGSDDVRLKLMTSLERPLANSYNISVVAFDGGTPPKTGSLDVYITVSDVVDDSLQFSNDSYDITIDENVVMSTVVTEVTATTRRPGAVIAYSFDAFTEQHYGQMFAIANDTGVIYVVGPVDAEQNANCLLAVVAINRQQPGSLPAYSRVFVNIRNVNDNAPQISISTLTSGGVSTDGVARGDVAGGAAVGTFIAYVGVSDPDSIPDTIECSINSTLFRLERIDAGDYLLTSAVVFDRGHDPLYPIAIACQDGGDGRLPVLRTVQLIDVIVVDSGPRFTTIFAPAIRIFAGNDPPGTFVTQLNATSNDVGPEAEISYSLSAITEMSQSFLSIDSRTGTVTTRLVFGPETVNQTYVFNVIAVDRGIPPLSANTTLLIEVVSSNIIPTHGATTHPVSNPTSISEITLNTTRYIAAAAVSSPTDSSLRNLIIIASVVSAGVAFIGCTIIVAAVVCCCRRHKLSKPLEVHREFGTAGCTVDVMRSESVTSTCFPDVLHSSSPKRAVDSYAPMTATSTSSKSSSLMEAHRTSTPWDHRASSCLPGTVGDLCPTDLRCDGWRDRQSKRPSPVPTDDSQYQRTSPIMGRPPRPGFTAGNDVTTRSAIRSPPNISSKKMLSCSLDSKSFAHRTGDPEESDSGCSSSLPDSGRGLSDEGDRWNTPPSGQSINTTSALIMSQPPTSDISSGSYSPTRAAQFLSTGLGRGILSSSFYHSLAPRGTMAEMQDSRPIRFCDNSTTPSECSRTTSSNEPLNVKCDTYV